jgi:glycosyltransferase involved in cell wall biosynthesis
METSIIIRTKNEEEWLGECLEMIFQQTYKNFEIIIVDSESSDGTLEIAKKYPVKILNIKQEDFSFSYALNFGIKNSNAEKFIVILSAHSIPMSKYWLEKGIENFDKSNKIAGVYGPQKALPISTIWDKFFYSFFYYSGKLVSLGRKRRIVRRSSMGVLGFTNAIIRKDLWKKRVLNESVGFGGEDGEWAGYWMKNGYCVVKDYDFAVQHSHNLDFSGWIRQWQHWFSSGKARKFSKEYLAKYRKNLM